MRAIPSTSDVWTARRGKTSRIGRGAMAMAAAVAAAFFVADHASIIR
jgi:hypothetical protein